VNTEVPAPALNRTPVTSLTELQYCSVKTSIVCILNVNNTRLPGIFGQDIKYFDGFEFKLVR
jgi:hypothetical protein